MVRVTGWQHATPKQLQQLLPKSETENQTPGAPTGPKVFFLVGPVADGSSRLASTRPTMLISPLPGAGNREAVLGFPLYPGTNIQLCSTPILTYGVMKGAPLTIANFRVVHRNGNPPLIEHHHQCGNANRPLVAGVLHVKQ